jgi:hypothetical protein
MDQGEKRHQKGAQFEVIGKDNRETRLVFRVNAKELFVWNQVHAQLGFRTEAHTFRYLVEHFGDIEQARKLLDAFQRRKQAEGELNALIHD